LRAVRAVYLICPMQQHVTLCRFSVFYSCVCVVWLESSRNYSDSVLLFASS
jgi:hypothetical protein